MTFDNQVRQTLLRDISIMANTPELFSKCPEKNTYLLSPETNRPRCKSSLTQRCSSTV